MKNRNRTILKVSDKLYIYGVENIIKMDKDYVDSIDNTVLK
jgi:hypothetical protein